MTRMVPRDMSPAAAPDEPTVKPRRWRALRRVNQWIRRRLFREEQWTVRGGADAAGAAGMLQRASDHGRPFLFSLPRLWFNRLFLGRITEQDISLKRRTHPAIWPISPGTYYFSGRMMPAGDGGLTVEGVYKLRPTLAAVYYFYFTIGAISLTASVLSTLLGLGMWLWFEHVDTWIFRTGLRMTISAVSYGLIGMSHIALEKWLDRGNRIATHALLERAAGAG